MRFAAFCFVFLTLLAITSPAIAAKKAPPPLIWGAVGHNDRPRLGRSYPYNRFSVEEQFDLMQKAGLRAYRAGCEDGVCNEIIEAAEKRGFLFLRSIEMRPDAHADEEENYKRGFEYAKDEAQKFKGKIRYYEASNELDNWTGMSGDGSTRNQYDADNYARARGFLKGLIDGVHQTDPDAKVLVDDAGWCHYGFLESLWNDGIRWDITALHWYESHGNIEHAGCNEANIAAKHAAFGLPLWITEFNADTSVRERSGARAAAWIRSFIQQIQNIAPQYNIQAAFVYELYDEPQERRNERFFGIADDEGTPKASWQTLKESLGDQAKVLSMPSAPRTAR